MWTLRIFLKFRSDTRLSFYISAIVRPLWSLRIVVQSVGQIQFAFEMESCIKFWDTTSELVR